MITEIAVFARNHGETHMRRDSLQRHPGLLDRLTAEPLDEHDRGNGRVDVSEEYEAGEDSSDHDQERQANPR